MSSNGTSATVLIRDPRSRDARRRLPKLGSNVQGTCRRADWRSCSRSWASEPISTQRESTLLGWPRSSPGQDDSSRATELSTGCPAHGTSSTTQGAAANGRDPCSAVALDHRLWLAHSRQGADVRPSVSDPTVCLVSLERPRTWCGATEEAEVDPAYHLFEGRPIGWFEAGTCVSARHGQVDWHVRMPVVQVRPESRSTCLCTPGLGRRGRRPRIGTRWRGRRGSSQGARRLVREYTTGPRRQRS